MSVTDFDRTELEDVNSSLKSGYIKKTKIKTKVTKSVEKSIWFVPQYHGASSLFVNGDSLTTSLKERLNATTFTNDI